MVCRSAVLLAVFSLHLTNQAAPTMVIQAFEVAGDGTQCDLFQHVNGPSPQTKTGDD